jgi:hypothetical protein
MRRHERELFWRDAQNLRGVPVHDRGRLPAVYVANGDHTVEVRRETGALRERGERLGRAIREQRHAHARRGEPLAGRDRVRVRGQFREAGQHLPDLFVARAGDLAQRAGRHVLELGVITCCRQRHAVSGCARVPLLEQVRRLADAGERFAQGIEIQQRAYHIEGNSGGRFRHD